MTLRKRTLLLTALTLAALIAIVYLASQRILLNTFHELEDQYASQNVRMALDELSDQMKQLGVNVTDWAAWDDTYHYMLGEDPEFKDVNLVDTTFTTLRINVMVLVDPSGDAVYAEAYNLAANQFDPLPPDLLENLQPGNPAVQKGVADHPVTGLLMLDQGALMVAAHPILTSEREGPAAGTLLMGRWLSEPEVSSLLKGPATAADLIGYTQINPGDDIITAREAIRTPNQLFTQTLNEGYIAGYALLHDLSGRPALILRVIMARDISHQAQMTLLYFILALVGIGVVFSALILYALERQVLSRLFSLSASVERIRASEDLSIRLSDSGKDELSSLTNAINAMLSALQESREDLRKANDELEARVQLRTVELAEANDELKFEIAERRRAEEQIRTALEEKDVLLKEIHHRVKNNLQVVSSMLYLKSRRIKDLEAQEMFQDSQNRIKSMALIHERLYQSKDLSHIDFGEYVEALVRDLFLSYSTDSDRIGYQVNVNGTQLTLDNAIPCGLIINELVTNSLKYAFPNERPGEICIDVKHEGPEYVLRVSDNGQGFPSDVDFRSTRSLGLQLVNRLVDQMDGSIELDVHHGTTYTIHFNNGH